MKEVVSALGRVYSALINGVGGKTVVVSTGAIAFTGSSARASGDYCGPDTTPGYIDEVVQKDGGTGIIKCVTAVDYTTTTPVNLELWLYSTSFTAPADNAAWTITDAEELAGFVAVIPMPSSKWYASGANQVFTDDTMNIPVKAASGSKKFYYALVARGTTPAWSTSNKLSISLGVLQD